MEFTHVDPIPAVPDFERVVDGFFYDFRLRPMCLAYLPLALGHEMLEVRAAYGDRRPRYVVFPKNPNTQIGVTSFYEEQVPVLPGTLIWGIGVTATEATLTQLENYSLRITDLQTGFEIFSEFVGIEALNMYAGSGNPFILPEPHIVLSPGSLLAEIGARQAVAEPETIGFSVILFCSEPVQLCSPSAHASAGNMNGMKGGK